MNNQWHHTMNPVPSDNPCDAEDNARSLDLFSLSDKPTYPDRLKRHHLTLFGMNQKFNNFMDSLDYVKVPYVSGNIINVRTQYVIAPDGSAYQVKPTTQLPYELTGDWATDSPNFMLMGDLPLRAELLSNDGPKIIGYKETSLYDTLSSVVFIEEFRSEGDSDSDVINKAIQSGASSIIASSGRTYLVSDIEIKNPLTIHGNGAKFKKQNKSGNILKIFTMDGTVSFRDLFFDGSYKVGDDVFQDDIFFMEGQKGLTVNFIYCKFDGISKRGINTGFLEKGYIKKLNFISPTHLPNNKQRFGDSSPEALIEAHNVGVVKIDDWSVNGSGVFDIGNGTQLGWVESPPLSIYATFSKLEINGKIEGSGGVVAYSGCDFSNIDIEINNCFYGVTCQESLLPKISGKFTNIVAPFRGAITIQPYARVNYSYGRKDEGIYGAVLSRVYFENNPTHLSLTGSHNMSGLYGVSDCRLYGVEANNCYFGKSKSSWMSLSDCSVYFDNCRFDNAFHESVPAIGNRSIVLFSSAVSGLGDVIFEDCSFSQGSGGASSIFQHSSLWNQENRGGRIRVTGGKVSGFSQVSDFIFIARGAYSVSLENIHFENEPKLIAHGWVNDFFGFKLCTGISYPTSKVSINYDTCQSFFSDNQKNTQVSFGWSNSKPEYQASLGTIIRNRDPIKGNASAWIMTESGWEPYIII